MTFVWSYACDYLSVMLIADGDSADGGDNFHGSSVKCTIRAIIHEKNNP